MIRYERWGLLFVFNYRDWRDMVHAGYALYAIAMFTCEALAPGWAGLRGAQSARGLVAPPDVVAYHVETPLMSTEAFLPQTGAANGHELAPVPPDEWQRIEQAYREIQRRDGSAEQRAWRWERVALVMVALFGMLLGVVVWQLLDARKVQAVVQVVQVDDKGQLVQTGIPQDLLTYTPPDGLWMDMLGEWVRRVRWRGVDTVLARAEWAWLYRHTCDQARRLLQTLEEREKPFQASKKLVAVELKSVTKTPVPESYQVLWAETSTEQAQPTVHTHLWTGTFSVGRYRPPTLADILDNRLGLCVTAFDLSPQP